MTTMTPEDAIRAASSVARDVADGKLSPTDLERQAVAELRELVGTVIGPDDPAWPLQCDIARGVLAVGGIPATELAEWLAVERHRGRRAGQLAGASPDPAGAGIARQRGAERRFRRRRAGRAGAGRAGRAAGADGHPSGTARGV